MSESKDQPFFARRRLHLVIILFVLITIAAGVAPTDRMEWWEGNIPIIALLVILTGSYRWWPLSDLSYVLLGTFLLLATVGSHYSYEHSPVGWWLTEALGGVRNPYDPLVHLCVGLLIYYPVYENLSRIARCRAPWSYLLPVAIILATSAIWEIAEVYYGIGLHQNPGYAGTDDMFDSQHDMAMALLGSVIAMAITAGMHGLRRPHPQED